MPTIRLEIRNENFNQWWRLQRAMVASALGEAGADWLMGRGGFYSKPWIAKVDGKDAQFGFKRTFLRGRKDYSASNSIGSRGVYLAFDLDAGVYDISDPYGQHARYFARVDSRGNIERITKEEVVACLSSLSE